MTSDRTGLSDFWRVRNAAAATLALSEEQMRRAVSEANLEQLVRMIESFSPAHSTGPDWTRSFEPLVERLWVWRDAATMAALADVFGARGMPWLAVTNALSPEHGTRLRETLRQPASARLPAFTLV